MEERINKKDVEKSQELYNAAMKEHDFKKRLEMLVEFPIRNYVFQ